MANTNNPNGARPYGAVKSLRKYVASAATYPGDFMKLKSDGTIEAAGATDACIGVAMSYASASNAQNLEVLVADDPDQLFIIQSDGAEVSAQTAINLNYAINAASPNTTYKQSREQLDASTGDTTATLPLKLLALLGEVKKDAFGVGAECVVAINNHQLKGGTGTLGV